MNILLKIIGIIIILDGILVLVKPGLLKMVLEFFAQGKWFYLAALLKGAFGVFFLFGVSAAENWPWLIMTFGVLGLAAAVFILVIPAKIQALTGWFAQRSEFSLRLLFFVYVLFGVLIIYAAG